MTKPDLRILAVETSGRRGGVALGSADGLIDAAVFSAERRHAVELLPTVEKLCRRQHWDPADIDEVYVSCGPGSFTGLRVGITFARTLAMATGARVVAVPTLEIIAQNALEVREVPPPRVAVVLDAKRQQVYGAGFSYRHDRYDPVGEPVLASPGELLAQIPSPIWVMGEGVAYHRQAIEQSGAAILPERYWPARAERVLAVGRRMADAGRYTDYRFLVPHYLRRPEAEEKWEARRRSARSACSEVRP